MMNLDEILRGIGSQMSKGIPQWDGAGLQPQVQNPAPNFPSMGSFSGYLAGQFPEGGSSSYGSMFPEKQPDGFGAGLFPTKRTQDALGHIAAATTPSVYQKGTPAGNDQEVEQYIRNSAAARKIDPNIATQVWGGEGRNNYAGDLGSSFGPYQLHYGGVAAGGNAVGGLGDAFTKATGLDARDPSTWQAQVDWSLDHASKNGWGPWHGYTGGAWDGIGSWAGGSPSQSSPGAPQAQAIMQKVQPFLNKDYVWGGKSPTTGFDCSGLAGWLTTGQPESTVTLHTKSAPVSEQQAQPGDLVFYNMNQPDMHIQHVAVYLGNGKIIQSGGTENTVNVGNAHQAVGSSPEFRRVPVAQPS